MSDTGFDSLPERRPVNEAQKDGAALLTELNRVAPLSPQSDQELQAEGWKEFWSYYERDFRMNPNVHDIQMTLDEIRKTTAVAGDWDIVRAKCDQAKNSSNDHERMRAVLKKETAQREEWERSRGYR